MALTKVQTKRLLNVARALRDAHAAKMKFDMEKWVFGDEGSIERSAYNYDTNSYGKACNNEAEFCGTPACALGHYASRTDLQRVLKVSILKNDDGVKFASMDYFGGQKGDGVDFWDANLRDHFGLDADEL